MGDWHRAGALVTALALAGCGGGDGDTRDGGASSDAALDDAGAEDAGAPDAGNGDIDARCVPLLEAALEAGHSNGAPGGGFAFVEEGELVCVVPWGIERAGTDRAVTPDTVFRWGTNPVAIRLVALELAARGELDLDAAVEDVLGDLDVLPASWASEIRVHHLIWGTSGLPYGEPYLKQMVDGCSEAGPSLEEFVDTVEGGERVMVAEPGVVEAWSRLGSALVVQVIEATSGEPLADAAQRVLFEPLGMTDSWIGWNEELAAREVLGHASAAGGLLTVVDSPLQACEAAQAMGGLATSLADAARLATVLARGGLDDDGTRVLAEDTVAAMYDGRAPHFWESSLSAGMIGPVGDEGDTRTTYRSGRHVGFTSGHLFASVPRVAVVELSNFDFWKMQRPVGLALARSRGWRWPTEDYGPASAWEPPLEELSEYVGDYQSPIACESVTVELREGVLIGRLGESEYELHLVDPDRFTLNGRPEGQRVAFWRKDGAIRVLTIPGFAEGFYPSDAVPSELSGLVSCGP